MRGADLPAIDRQRARACNGSGELPAILNRATTSRRVTPRFTWHMAGNFKGDACGQDLCVLINSSNMYDWDCGLDFAGNQGYHRQCVEAHLGRTGNVSRAAEEPRVSSSAFSQRASITYTRCANTATPNTPGPMLSLRMGEVRPSEWAGCAPQSRRASFWGRQCCQKSLQYRDEAGCVFGKSDW
jgi:hypothetical protein